MRIQNIIGLAMNFMSVDWDKFKDAEVSPHIANGQFYLLFKLGDLFERVPISNTVEEWDTTIHYLDFHVRKGDDGNNYLVQLFPLTKHCKLDDMQAERVSEIIERYNEKVSELNCKLNQIKKIHKEIEEVIE